MSDMPDGRIRGGPTEVGAPSKADQGEFRTLHTRQLDSSIDVDILDPRQKNQEKLYIHAYDCKSIFIVQIFPRVPW